MSQTFFPTGKPVRRPDPAISHHDCEPNGHPKKSSPTETVRLSRVLLQRRARLLHKSTPFAEVAWHERYPKEHKGICGENSRGPGERSGKQRTQRIRTPGKTAAEQARHSLTVKKQTPWRSIPSGRSHFTHAHSLLLILFVQVFSLFAVCGLLVCPGCWNLISLHPGKLSCRFRTCIRTRMRIHCPLFR